MGIVPTKELPMTFVEAAVPNRKPRGTKQSLKLVKANDQMRVHAEINPPLKEGKAHTVDIKKGTTGIVCGPAPDGFDGHLGMVEFGKHHPATTVVAADQVSRL